MREDCVVQSVYGLVGEQGVVFSGSSESTLIIPPNGYYGLLAVPGQSLFITFSSAPVKGTYMHFYRSIQDKLPLVPELVNGRWQYKLTKGPDFSLRYTDGQLLPVNVQTLSFSANGNWMAFDIWWMGFVRINLATFNMVPFAQSMNMGNDYANYDAQVGLSNDGRYAAIKPGNGGPELMVYDIESCRDAVMPVSRYQPKCQSRDYWPYIESQLAGLKMVYKPRFINATQLSFTAMHAFTGPGKYKVSQYVLTAPGESPTGIEYLGMGDSFASGQGAFNYIAGTDTSNNTCHLSSLSYPFLLSADLFSSGRSVACSGAKMRDITEPAETYEGQVKDGIFKNKRNNAPDIIGNYIPGYFVQNDFASVYNPQRITLSIGGNDIGFSDIVKQCVMPKLKDTTCFPAYEDQKELVDRITSVEGRLTTTYRTVAAPGRQTYIIGYPHIVAANGNCAANVHLDAQEITLFIALTDVLNATIRRAAEKAGVHYVDVSRAFDGHRMCETKSSRVAVNGFTIGNDDGVKHVKFIGAESYHPNALGHELLKRAILGQTNNLKQPDAVTPPVVPPSLPLPSAPQTGRPTRASIYGSTLLPDTLKPASAVSVQVDANTALLKSSSSFTLKLGNTGTVLGTANTDAAGNLSGAITVPNTLPCGYHIVHLIGVNILNQALDINKVVYVDTGNSHCGETESNTACGMVPASGQDADEDDIDDACDPAIADPPAQPAYRVYLTGSSIHAKKP